MQFSEDLAKEISVKHKIGEATIKTWRHRGTIPDKYGNPEFVKPIAPDKSKSIVSDRILNILAEGLLNVTLLCNLSDVTPQKFADVKRGKAVFSEQEIISLKKEINRARILIAKTFERRSHPALKELLKSEMFLLRPILLSGGATLTDYDRASRFRRDEYSLDDKDYIIIKNCFVKFALQLGL